MPASAPVEVPHAWNSLMASAAASCAFPGYRRMADIGFFGRHVRRECGSEHPHGCQAGWCSGGSAVDRQSWPAMRSRAAPVPAALPSASGVIHIAIFRYATSISYLFARDRHLRLLIGWATLYLRRGTRLQGTDRRDSCFADDTVFFIWLVIRGATFLWRGTRL